MKIKLALLAFLLVPHTVVAHGRMQTGAKGKPAVSAQHKSGGGSASKKAALAPKYALSEEQKRAIQKIRSEIKLKGALIAVRIAQSAKAFDDNILSDSPSAESDAKSQKGITDALADATALRLQAIRDVLVVLTPEQKQLLKEEMSKPGAPPEGLLDVLARLFKLTE